MKHLGIDFGKKRVGLAISDDTNTLAFPLKTLKNDANLISEIMKVITEYEIVTIILGESKDFKMKENVIMKEIHAFKSQLETLLADDYQKKLIKHPIKVIFHPEVLSSAQVVSIMGSENKAIDASAAAVILQGYLDSLK